MDGVSQYYELKSIVSYIGLDDYSGHYVSLVKSNNNWFGVNDSHVTKIDIAKQLPCGKSTNSYLLFYVKCFPASEWRHKALHEPE